MQAAGMLSPCGGLAQHGPPVDARRYRSSFTPPTRPRRRIPFSSARIPAGSCAPSRTVCPGSARHRRAARYRLRCRAWRHPLARSHTACRGLWLDINARRASAAAVNAALNGAEVTAQHSDLLAGTRAASTFSWPTRPTSSTPALAPIAMAAGAIGAGLSARDPGCGDPRLDAGGTLLLYTGSAIVEGATRFRGVPPGPARSGRAFAWTYEEVDPDVFGEELESGPYAGR